MPPVKQSANSRQNNQLFIFSTHLLRNMSISVLPSRLFSYSKESLTADLKSGVITAVVALPLAIAFALASGVPPIAGMYTAIIAGVLGSLFGGSRFSITGPTGAMAVIILETINKYGFEGLMLAGLLAGIILLIFGICRFGVAVKYIPMPIITGFTAGIGVVIFSGQVANFFGLTLKPQEELWQNYVEIARNIGHTDLRAVGIAAFTICCLLFIPPLVSKVRGLRNIPASFFALVITTGVVIYFALDIPVVGDIPSGIPKIHILNFSPALVRAVLPAAFTIALLGAIESLLCAVVCDGMTNTRHNSDRELVSQGIANIVLPFFTAIPCTAAVARSAVNIREGAKTRCAGIYHAICLLLIMLFFSPFAQYIPKAFLAGILIVVSLKMINIREFKTITKISRKDTIVLYVTFFLTIFTDLIFAVQAGMFLAVLILFLRLSSQLNIVSMDGYEKEGGINRLLQQSPHLQENVSVYTIHGALFFGAMSLFDRKLTEHIDLKKNIIILRMKHVPFIDITAVERLKDFIHQRSRENKTVILTTLQEDVQKRLFKDQEFRDMIDKKHIFGHTGEAIRYIEEHLLDKVGYPKK